MKSHRLYSFLQLTSERWSPSRCDKTPHLHTLFLKIIMLWQVDITALSHPFGHGVPNRITHMHADTYIYSVCSSLAWLRSEGLHLASISNSKLEASACLVSSPCEICPEACSLAQHVWVCRERWQLGSITHLVTRHSLATDTLAAWRAIIYNLTAAI